MGSLAKADAKQPAEVAVKIENLPEQDRADRVEKRAATLPTRAQYDASIQSKYLEHWKYRKVIGDMSGNPGFQMTTARLLDAIEDCSSVDADEVGVCGSNLPAEWVRLTKEQREFLAQRLAAAIEQAQDRTLEYPPDMELKYTRFVTFGARLAAVEHTLRVRKPSPFAVLPLGPPSKYTF
jgi:hypothetical protein